MYDNKISDSVIENMNLIGLLCGLFRNRGGNIATKYKDYIVRKCVMSHL